MTETGFASCHRYIPLARPYKQLYMIATRIFFLININILIVSPTFQQFVCVICVG